MFRLTEFDLRHIVEGMTAHYIEPATSTWDPQLVSLQQHHAAYAAVPMPVAHLQEYHAPPESSQMVSWDVLRHAVTALLVMAVAVLVHGDLLFREAAAVAVCLCMLAAIAVADAARFRSQHLPG
jgi:hypothetical protein